MNITELARRLKIPTTELKEKLPELGFDIGMRAIKVNDRLAQQIIEKWNAERKRSMLEEKVLAEKEKHHVKDKVAAGGEVVMLPPVISVRDLADKFDMKVAGLIAELMRNGVMASISDKVDYEIAAIVAEGLGLRTEKGDEMDTNNRKSEEMHMAIMKNKSENQTSKDLRPPVVVVMGHVDHGKTRLLDAIRKTQVVEGESGGITQHIGAYQAQVKDRYITFIDTPGHEAFSHMRSRGAVIADVAILVVAADDGVQPQTIEAIKMIQDAKLPMVVAINKIDKPEANVNNVKKGLAEINIQIEDWGGDVPAVEISAKQETNLNELLEVVLLVADINKEKLQTRNSGPASGSIIESHIDKGAGPVATVLIHAGQLKVGDSFQVGDVNGKIRAMKNFKGELVDVALPSTPVQIIGLSDVPESGMMLIGGVDLKKIRRLNGKKKQKKSNNLIKTKDNGDDKETKRPHLNIILKADVAGSLEAIENSLSELDTKEVQISVINKGLGSITEVDVVRAEESQAIVYGFHVDPTTQARQLAQEKNVKIELVDVIYHLLEKVEKEVEIRLEPEIIRHELGKVELIKIFGKRDGGLVVGGKVKEGKLRDTSKFIIYRNEKVMGEGKVTELRIGPDKRPEVNKGDECGLRVNTSTDLWEDDLLEFFEEEIKQRSLK